MPTRKQIVQDLAATVGRPYDIPLQKQLTRILMYKRLNYLQQSLAANIDQRIFYTQEVIIDLVPVDAALCPTDETGCSILVSNCDIPQPIRSKRVVFDYVGSLGGMDPWQHWPHQNIRWVSHARFTHRRPKWDFIDQKIFVYNNTQLKRARIAGVFEDPYAVSLCSCGEGTPCLNEDDEFPAPADLLNAIIRDILQVELGVRPPIVEKDTTTIDEPEHVNQNRTAQGT